MMPTHIHNSINYFTVTDAKLIIKIGLRVCMAREPCCRLGCGPPSPHPHRQGFGVSVSESRLYITPHIRAQ